ncbi:hypothetical protein BH18ACT10_BH18ACT10_11570 [soil metagenome]|nr:twin-arginine translocase TatA/TatE family subunit [Rubrobacter sp.]
MFGSLGPTELIVALVIILLLFGAKKVPELARGLGSGVKEFRAGTREGEIENKKKEEEQKKEEQRKKDEEDLDSDSVNGKAEGAHDEHDVTAEADHAEQNQR